MLDDKTLTDLTDWLLGMGAMRRRTPAALLETGETSLRAEQRIDALSSVLRSVVTFVNRSVPAA
jgi:hypothetical protein